ncbi:protein kinase [Streptomyces sp. NPDC052079]|uniref:serine/threonine protein kinase n=1 Tax=Streptomyces sp. NPDC052079 TaxID=3155526 RepID=UPI00341F1492
MGRVWRAADEMLDRQVAVKEMRMADLGAEDSGTRRERSLREARATARIDHPNVVRVYDVVDEGERLWIVMELVHGRSLERIIAEDGPLGPRGAADVGLGLLEALRQVHARGVLHRDIKPGNVLVEEGERRRMVLTDFGIAAIQDAKALTMVGMLVGSPDYMAPERVSGRPQGPPSDLWSLGATLCAALAGHSPFARATTLATLHAVLYEPPEIPPVAGPLREILTALLDKNPDARPGLETLRSALTSIADPPPLPTLPAVPATPPSAAGIPGTDEPAPGVAGEPPAPEAVNENPGPDSAPGATPRLPDAAVELPAPASQNRTSRPDEEPEPHVPGPGAASKTSEATDGSSSSVPVVRGPGPGGVSPAPAAAGGGSGVVGQGLRPGGGPHGPEPGACPDGSGSGPGGVSPGPRAAGGGSGVVGQGLRPGGGPHGPEPGAGPDRSGSGPGGVSPVPDVAGGGSAVELARAVTERRPSPVPRSAGGSAPAAADRRRAGRRRAVMAAAVVGTAAAALAVVLVTRSGEAGHGNRADATASASSVTGSRSPTVEGTSRPATLPPGARREAGGFAWVPPEGWRRDVQTGAEIHYTSPDGGQELAAKSSLARGDLLDTWQTSERNAHQGQDYRKIRLEETTFRGHPAVVWDYAFTLKGLPWHARLLGFNVDGKSYQINTWYRPENEAAALRTYEEVKKSFTVL